jgi:uncharacterized circularly permuted ATP-grasp superfamily protein
VQKSKETKAENAKNYNPNMGFIGKSEVKVANYLFSLKRKRSAHKHAKVVASRILKQDISKTYKESKELTKFLKLRDLTFSKKTKKGYKTFVVPCTNTVVPLQKSLFNQVEEAAQVLVIAMRKVLQDIYGAKSLEDSTFIQALPEEVRENFIKATESSAHYYKQLHHPNMKDYPFFDNVGLDLVLVEDYINGKTNQLPFRILELNAGSPSGASNNMNMLEGIYEQTPEILDRLGKLLPNDHFDVLGATFKSLGEAWTQREDGVQIILPPGGENGAAPEIHQLAAYSGLIYADPDQLYSDTDGYIRLRTVSGNNPIVNAVYSRINSDSALYDEEIGIILRDPDSGEPIYLRDNLNLNRKGEGKVIQDEKGNPIPLQSDYAIPNAVEAIVNRKLYMGGLNRILDNKIILATLTHFAPKYYAKEIARMGLNPDGAKIAPPQTLPSVRKSVDVIKANPEEWVIKAPNLAGGQGVYIMKTLPESKRREVLEMITKEPEEFAYQQLVKIARIPVAIHRKDEGFRFANLAADLRMWVFYGGDGLPRMTHNALVRYAPQEKGSMSSIVNTSAGGGYAPFVIVDDTNDIRAKSAAEVTRPRDPKPLQAEIPAFVGAQIVQISRLASAIRQSLYKNETTAYEILGKLLSIKSQSKEILSFLHPRAIEEIYKLIHIVESKIRKKEVEAYFIKVQRGQIAVANIISNLEKNLSYEVMDILDNMRILDNDVIERLYTDEDRALDVVMYDELKSIIGGRNQEADRLLRQLKIMLNMEYPKAVLSDRRKASIARGLNKYLIMSAERLIATDAKDMADLLLNQNEDHAIKFETLFLDGNNSRSELVATAKEFATGISLFETGLVLPELAQARMDWTGIVAKAKDFESTEKESFLAKKRLIHLAKYPFLYDYQRLMQKSHTTVDDLIKALEIVPYAKYNVEMMAKELGITVRELFVDKVTPNRIAILSSEQILEEKLANREYAGECFAKKKQSHDLYSNAETYIWVRKDLDPFTVAYTIGHEIIHFHQIRKSISEERTAYKQGKVPFAKSLNLYGNFLSVATRTLESMSALDNNRILVYGYLDRLFTNPNRPIIKDLRMSLKKSDDAWNVIVEEYAGTLGYALPSNIGTKVKALQEVLPALENAKNILFAKDLGLIVYRNCVKSALPTSNDSQQRIYSKLIMDQARSQSVDWEALRVIASHQLYGVRFGRADREEENLTLVPDLANINIGRSYNQSQQ